MEPRHAETAGPSARAERLALALFVGGAALSLVWLVDPYFQCMWDAVLYLLTTRSLVAGEGYAVYGEPFSLRPPGFSLMLAPVVAVFGEDFGVLNLFVSLIGIAALALLFRWYSPRLGVVAAFAVCVSLWINPQYQRICNATLSDTAGLAATVLCLLLDRRARERQSLGADLLVGLAIGAAMYLRTVSFLLVPAIALARLLDRRTPSGRQPVPRKLGRLAVLAALAALLQVPWSLWVDAHPPPLPPDQNGIYSYSVAQWQEDAADPGSPRVPLNEVLQRTVPRSRQCMTGIGLRVPNATPPGVNGGPRAPVEHGRGPRGLGYALGWLAVGALLFTAFARRDAGAFFALGNLAVLLVYFDFGERILFPVYVFALGAVVEVAQIGLKRFVPESRARGAVAALVLAMGVWDATPPNERDFVRARNETNAKVAAWVESNYPPDVVVAGSFGHKLAPFFERPVWFVESAAKKRGFHGALDVLRRRKADLFVYTGPENKSQRFAFAPIVGQGMTLVHQVDHVRIYELNRYRAR